MLLTATIPVGEQPPKYGEFKRELDRLCDKTDGPFRLKNCSADMDWPDRGIYIFFEPDTDSASTPPRRWYITRIGTVGDCQGSTQTLWERLRAHRGNKRGDYAGGGNNRGSVFRRHLGAAWIRQEGLEDYPHWGTPHSQLPDDLSTTSLREQEHPLEKRVSNRIREMPFLVLNVPGEPGPNSDRAQLERDLIAFVSQHRNTNPKLKRDETLRSHSRAGEIVHSDLWNVNHVSELYTGSVVDELSRYIDRTEPP